MTLLDFEELVSYWAQHPPLHLLMAAYLGVDNPKKRELNPSRGGRGANPAVTGRSDFTSLLAVLGPGFGTGDVHAGLEPVVLDFAELRCRARRLRLSQ